MLHGPPIAATLFQWLAQLHFMNCQVYWKKQRILLSELLDNKTLSDKMTSFYSLEEALKYLDNKPGDLSIDQKVGMIIEELKNLEVPEDKKVGFICEQLSLMNKKPNGRRYSLEVLAMAGIWESVPPTAYAQRQRQCVNATVRETCTETFLS